MATKVPFFRLTWEGRDRYFQDPGHMSPMLYSVLALAGKFTIDELKDFRQWGSVTPGHPELNVMRGIENTSGPLGQGHTYAVGAAIAAKFLKARLGEVMGCRSFLHHHWHYYSLLYLLLVITDKKYFNKETALFINAVSFLYIHLPLPQKNTLLHNHKYIIINNNTNIL